MMKNEESRNHDAISIIRSTSDFETFEMYDKMNQFAIKCVLVLLVGGFAAMRPVSLHGQVVVGSGSAALEIQSTTGGLLLPRLTTTERNNMSAPANGLTIYNTTTLCVEINHGTSSSPAWSQVQCRTGSITQFTCGSTTVNGTLTRSQAASGVTITVPYTGGNGGVYSAISLASTGVTGLTATAAAGNVASGAGNLVLNISGTPASAGTATFALSLGGQTCSVSATVNDPAAAITQLDCAAATVNGLLFSGMATTATVSIPYTGGNSGTYSAQTLSSTGVTGLTATLSAGTVATGSGSITLTLSGTAATTGTASFALSFGGQSCALNLTITTVFCRAKVDATTFKNFYCYNLGSASTTVDPFTPSWEINGGYWQWGWTAVSAAGPSGPGSSQTNEGAQAGWPTFYQGDNVWQDATKSPWDPCPTGFKVPTRTQWEGVIANNTYSNLGTWTGSSTNYSSGKMIGTQLMLPAAGLRNISDGSLGGRGSSGYYWASTTDGAGYSRSVYFLSGPPTSAYSNRTNGFSVRCIAE